MVPETQAVSTSYCASGKNFHLPSVGRSCGSSLLFHQLVELLLLFLPSKLLGHSLLFLLSWKDRSKKLAREKDKNSRLFILSAEIRPRALQIVLLRRYFSCPLPDRCFADRGWPELCIGMRIRFQGVVI